MYRINWSHSWQGRLTKPLQDTIQANLCMQRMHQEISKGFLPFISMPYKKDLEQQITGITPFLRTFKHMVVLGIGGSALGSKALQQAFFPQQQQPQHKGPYLWIIDNVDSQSMLMLLTQIKPKETIFVTISKSGETIETMAQYFIAKEWLKKNLKKSWRKHLLLVTDEHTGFLRKEIHTERLRSLPVPQNLGGRYSILSAVSLIPSAFMDINWKNLLSGANDVLQQLQNVSLENFEQHPSWKLAEWGYSLIQTGYSQLIFFNYIPSWGIFGQWFTQLWAESLGKNEKGSMPIPAIGVTDQHSTQQMFLDGPKDKGCILLSKDISHTTGLSFPEELPANWSWLKNKTLDDLLEAEKIGTAAALATKQIPLLQIQFPNDDEYAAGNLIALCMAATLFTGWLLDLNPLDQPAVELGKRLARLQLGDTQYKDEASILNAFLSK